VLVLGETGTGKELVARALHQGSRRRNGTFLAENCAAVPASLLESELFGHKRGSFTGAVADRDGHFVAASGGTLFLDEIGDMPLDMQVKLLRVLENGEVRPVGGNATVKVDVRVVAATHRDLEAMVRRRSFRDDLYYRLAVMRIQLPPLRDRPEDIEALARRFLAVAARDDGAEPRELTAAALVALKSAPWPGNVRQLENEIRRASVLSKGPIDVGDLSPALAGRD
jgi:transcriptional regulator with GAF, ATPase, and Fis domain